MTKKTLKSNGHCIQNYDNCREVGGAHLSKQRTFKLVCRVYLTSAVKLDQNSLHGIKTVTCVAKLSISIPFLFHVNRSCTMSCEHLE